jgi:hypothetical protein
MLARHFASFSEAETMRKIITLSAFVALFGIHGMAQTPATPAATAADQGVLLQKVSDAVNPEADGDRKELFRKGLAALADLNAAGTKPEQALDQAKAKGSLSGEKTEKMSKMLMEMWSLNVDRMSEPATLEALRAGKMPDPALKRP